MNKDKYLRALLDTGMVELEKTERLNHVSGRDVNGQYEPGYSTYEETELYTIPLTGYGDYVGSDVERTNQAYIKSEYGRYCDYRSLGYGYSVIGVDPDKLPKHIPHGHVLMSLLDDLDNLRGYPIFDDGDLYYEVQQDMFQENWDNWLAWEIGDDIGKWADDLDYDQLLEVYYSLDAETTIGGRYVDLTEHHFETGGAIVMANYEHLVKAMRQRIKRNVRDSVAAGL